MMRPPPRRSLSRLAIVRTIAVSSPEAMRLPVRCPRFCPSMRSCTAVHRSRGRFCWAFSLRWRDAHEASFPAHFFYDATRSAKSRIGVNSMIIDSTVMLDLLLVTLACFSAGAVGALATAPWTNLSRLVGNAGALLGALGAFALGIAGIVGGNLQLTVPDLLPIGGAALGVDRLSAFFVVVIAGGAIPEV